MSRLIVKNLPKSVTNESLKERFSSQGEVTDVQLKYTKDGKFRRFAFVGYQTADEANRAADYFNNTFINQSKVTVQLCSELGDSKKPKAWSRYAADSTAYKKLHPDENKPLEVQKEKPPKEKKIKGKKIDSTVIEKIKKYKDDPMFLEFMENSTKEGSAKDIFKSIVEDAADSGVEEETAEENKGDGDIKTEPDDIKTEPDDEKKSAAFAPISDLAYMKLKQKSSVNVDGEELKEVIKEEKQTEEKAKLFTVKITNLPYKTTKKHLKGFVRPLKPVSVRLPPKCSGFAYVSFKTHKEANKALIKNKSFLNGKQVLVKEYVDKGEEKDKPSVEKVEDKRKRWREQEEALFKEESIAESGSLFVRNLPYTTTEEELTKLFETYGPLAEVNLPVDRESRRVKGFGTVTFVMPEHAVAAHAALDGTVFHGRMLHLLPAKTTPHQQTTDEDGEGKSFKDKKKEKLKASAGQSHTWNSLFLGQNAVADMMAETYNVTKQQVLTGKDVAVRLALGETQLVSETRQFLVDSGVSLDAFNQAPKSRSKTVILVKNLPAKTTAPEIREEFCKFGELGRVVLPPSGVTGIVEFLEPSEARKAFFSLAYRKFKNLPLYLEWAPEETFSSPTSGTKDKDIVGKEGKEKVETDINTNEEKEETQESDEEEIEPEPDTTLYVKNLHFDTKEDGLKKHFGACGRVAHAMVARKLDPARVGQWLSMGYGFVRYATRAQTEQALKTLQHSQLDGHTLELKRSNRTIKDESAVARKKSNLAKQTGTTIMVRNIPFQAKQKEVQQLFQTFGELKSLRMPKKMVGSGPHRGFCFVEFLTKHDAKRAMAALCQSTHLFGRRLVLEWAQADADDVDQMRKRTALRFGTSGGATEPKRSKKATADLEIGEEKDDDDE